MRLFEHELTAREEEILACIVPGQTNKEIAALLHISAWTVQDHVRSIRRKLNVNSRTAAACMYIQRRSQREVGGNP